MEDGKSKILQFINYIAPLSAGVIVWYVSTVVTPISDDVKQISGHFYELNRQVASLTETSNNLKERVDTVEKYQDQLVPEIRVLASKLSDIDDDLTSLDVKLDKVVGHVLSED